MPESDSYPVMVTVNVEGRGEYDNDWTVIAVDVVSKLQLSCPVRNSL